MARAGDLLRARGLPEERGGARRGVFAVHGRDPFSVAEIEPPTAAVRWQRPLPGMRFHRDGGSWAFAAVGSDFFFFWADGEHSSTVTRLREDGKIEHVIRDSGIRIVGVGASTCATAR